MSGSREETKMEAEPTRRQRRAAIVTGASSGIGKGISLVLARAGYHISTVYKSNELGIQELEQTVKGTYGRQFHAVQGDLSDPAFVERYAAEAIRELGEVHLLVNNAGAGFVKHLFDIGTEEMLAFIHIDFVAPMLLMKHVGRHMKEKGIRGSLINITSTRAERAYPHDSLYGGMKAGLRRAAESIAIELAMHGIRVNNVAPGATEIERGSAAFYDKLGEKIPLRRVGQPEDIGEAVLWLASDAASYITGASLKVDGGLILPGMPEKDDETTKYYGWEPVRTDR
ncbi:SDR family NAD(P)-dependent oxidoreductase [Paenibacillus mucilaginosus]|uniref:Short-chain dehydrogenase/reductase SDR n=1 Tax=Paenibacillus mucilaginosus (strain KNP414) TaxID=1036673 RepID=F8F5A9_PAEMK|nr:SDR family oxidoreductase [Paenibacillus mucilaginosus]AEI40920.1 short-chain dehydrogenase/reductase SDR [Paenibacillus mucilaginosus KNP414]MCG7211624.1 SDR family oxidoreductase [Paenibacillus mucilaginosus]WDM30016.1 SDR family oxidoreductase [Paenibacillus mucilaginosus]